MSKQYYDQTYFEKMARHQLESQFRKMVFQILQWGSKYSCDLFRADGRAALDIGCAYGFGVKLLRRLGYDAYGVDISEYAVNRTREATLTDASRIRLHDVQDGIPFDRKFDLIMCFEVLEHLERPEKALENIFGKLNRGGVLVATTPNKWSLWPLIDREPSHINVRPVSYWKEEVFSMHFTVSKVREMQWLPVLPRIMGRFVNSDVTFLPVWRGASVWILGIK